MNKSLELFTISSNNMSEWFIFFQRHGAVCASVKMSSALKFNILN